MVTARATVDDEPLDNVEGVNEYGHLPMEEKSTGSVNPDDDLDEQMGEYNYYNEAKVGQLKSHKIAFCLAKSEINLI